MTYCIDRESGVFEKELAYFNAIPNPMICLNHEGRQRWLNSSAISLMEVLPINDPTHSGFDGWFKSCLIARQGKRSIELPGSSSTWWSCECYPVNEGVENRDTFIISMRDITEQKTIGLALQMSESKYKRLYNEAPMAFQSLDESANILEVNDQWLSILGYSRDEVIGKWIGNFLMPASLGKLESKFPEFKRCGHISNEIFHLKAKDGKIITVSFDGSIGRTPSGDFDRTYCVFRDVTKEFQTQRALILSEEKYRNVVENANEGICIIQDSRIVYANQTSEELIGYSIDEINSSYFLNFVHPDDRNLVTENHFRRLKGEDFPAYDFRLIQKNGGIRWVLFNATLTTFGERKAVLGFITDITKRKKAEERLKEEEEKYKLLVENLNDLVCLVDDSGRYTYLNSQYKKRFDYEISELKGQSAFSFILKEDRPKARKIFKSIRAGESHEEVLRFYDKHKGILWLNCKLHCFLDSEKNKFIEVVSNDITESILYQEKLLESERRYRSMFHKNGSNMVLIDPTTGLFTDINEAALDFLKIKPQQKNDLIVYDYVVMDHQLLNNLMLQIVNETRKYFHVKCRLGNGDIRDIEVHSALVEIDRKEMIFVIFNDISMRKVAEKEIALNNRRLTSMLKIAEYRAENYKDLLNFTLQEALRFTESHKGCLYFVDSEDETITLQTCQSLIGQAEHHKEGHVIKYGGRSELRDLLKRGKALVGDREEISGELLRVFGDALSDIMVVPVLERGIIVAFVVVSRDEPEYCSTDIKQLSLIMGNVWHIIEKQRSREELMVAKEKAEESERLKSAFLANMSHEIRTPLNAIVGFSNLLSSDEMDGDERSKFNEIIERNSEQLLALIDDIIDIAKIEGEQMRLNPENLDVKRVIQHMEMNFQEIKKRYNKPQLQIKAHYPTQELTCKLDGYRFNQIFYNLIGNAIKFTREGRIDFGLKYVNSKELLFFVKDTGVGIEESKQKIIFGEFSQEDETVASRYGGTGLGLTITKHLVEMMNGKIWVESKKGEGATFYFSIPGSDFTN